MKRIPGFLLLLVVLTVPMGVQAAPGITAVTVSNDGQTYSLTLQVLALMTVLTLLPAGMMMMTSFMRIVIVLAILRQAIGLMQAPSSQIVVGLSLFLTLFIMAPVFEQVNSQALQPYLNEQMEIGKAFEAAQKPFREFMLGQTRESDLDMFAKIAGIERIDSPESVPFKLLVPAFVTSELKTAFQIGFLIYIPFLVIDLVVASVLMAMGMMMLSPMMISLPFKIMLFVLVDGWALIMGTLASSFYV